jgi:molecular chaperone DnaK
VRTAATVEAIPASHPVGVEVLEKVGGRPRLAFLVNVGDALPKTGRIKLKATESLKSGSTGSINIKVWEGDISDPVSDNRFVGVLKVSGTDLDGGMIAVGEDLQCDYEVADSGNISISVSVPSIGATVGAGRNFYSPQDGQVDLSTASLQVAEEARGVLTRLNRIVDKVNDQRLSAMRDAVERATELKPESSNPESNKEQMDTVLQAKRLLADVRRTHLRELRDVDFEWLERFVTDVTRQYARPAEAKSIDGLFESARRAITRESGDFEAYLAEIRALNFLILWRQDWYVADTFKHLAASPHLFTDRAGFEELVVAGLGALEVDNFERLRQIVGTLQSQRIGWGGDDDMTLSVNIVQG